MLLIILAPFHYGGTDFIDRFLFRRRLAITFMSGLEGGVFGGDFSQDTPSYGVCGIKLISGSGILN